MEQKLTDFANGEYQVTRRRTHKRMANPAAVKAICAVKDDPALTFGRSYLVKILTSGRLLVNDNNGEPVICDASDFTF